jgi:hypothetical protein
VRRLDEPDPTQDGVGYGGGVYLVVPALDLFLDPCHLVLAVFSHEFLWLHRHPPISTASGPDPNRRIPCLMAG